MLGRALLAEPDWALNIRNDSNIKICIKCNVCYKRILNQQQIKCSINPYLGEEKRYEYFKNSGAKVLKKVVVLGAGPAGLEAALIASNRGHNVTLLEKEKQIGGNLVLASVPVFKKEIGKLVEYYEKEIKKSNINLKLGINANHKDIIKFKPDAVILAIGSNPIIPDIIGVSSKNVILATEVLKSNKVKLGKKLVIIGAGLVGLEIGLFLALKNHEVKIIDILKFDDLLGDESPGNKYMLTRMLINSGAEILCGTEVLKISGNEIIIRKENKEKETIRADNILVSVGFKPKDEEFNELENRLLAYKPELEIYKIGDCLKDGKIYDAINKAAHVAWRL